jgi:hypothetical protein
VPRRPDHLALLVDLTAHEEVILTHEGRVEHLVHQLVDDLRRHGPRASDPDRDGLGGARERLAAVHGLGVRGDHPRGHVDARPGKFRREHRAGEHFVDGLDQAPDIGLPGLRRASASEEGPPERIVEKMDVGAVLVRDLGCPEPALSIGDVDHRFSVTLPAPRRGKPPMLFVRLLGEGAG